MTMLLLDKDINITKIISEQKTKLKAKRLHEIKELRQLSKLERAELRRELKPVICNVVEHYQDSIFDVCNIQTAIMNLFWEGKENEKISGDKSIEDLYKNRGLMNFLVDELINAIDNNKVSEFNIDEAWDNSEREESFNNNKQFCRSCEKLTHQFENVCPNCNGFVFQSKGKEFKNDFI